MKLEWVQEHETWNSGGDQIFVFTFNNAIVSGNVNIGSGVARSSGVIISGNTVTANLSGVADGQVMTVVLTGRIDGLSGGKCRSSDIEAIHQRMVPFIAAGFRRLCAAA